MEQHNTFRELRCMARAVNSGSHVKRYAAEIRKIPIGGIMGIKIKFKFHP
jgi:hypothetical protein